MNVAGAALQAQSTLRSAAEKTWSSPRWTDDACVSPISSFSHYPGNLAGDAQLPLVCE